MELDLNSKLIDFLNEEYKIDFNNFKLLRFCRSKDEQLIFLIECEDKYFFIECSYFYKDRIRLFYEVKPKKGKTIEYYCDSNKCNNVILEMKDEKIYYSFKIEIASFRKIEPSLVVKTISFSPKHLLYNFVTI